MDIENSCQMFVSSLAKHNVKTLNRVPYFHLCYLQIDNSANVLKTIRNLYYDRLMCDVNLVVGKKEHPAHRLILCACSDVFQVSTLYSVMLILLHF